MTADRDRGGKKARRTAQANLAYEQVNILGGGRSKRKPPTLRAPTALRGVCV